MLCNCKLSLSSACFSALCLRIIVLISFFTTEWIWLNSRVAEVAWIRHFECLPNPILMPILHIKLASPELSSQISVSSLSLSFFFPHFPLTLKKSGQKSTDSPQLHKPPGRRGSPGMLRCPPYPQDVFRTQSPVVQRSVSEKDRRDTFTWEKVS